MKKLFIFAVTILLISCTDHAKVMEQYKKKNPNAKEMLLKGFNAKVSEDIDSSLIKAALSGDEEAKVIIYAQMEVLRGLQAEDNHYDPMPIYIHRTR